MDSYDRMDVDEDPVNVASTSSSLNVPPHHTSAIPSSTSANGHERNATSTRTRAEIDALLDRPLGEHSRWAVQGDVHTSTPSEEDEADEEDAESKEPEVEMWGNTSGLLARISKKKVYTMEGSGFGGSLDREDDDDDQNARRAPDTEIDFSFLREISSDTPIRPNALHLSGPPLAHLSTAKVFSYAGLYGGVVVAVEWISDTRLVLLYEDERAALKAINALAKTGFDPLPSTVDQEGEQVVSARIGRGGTEPKELLDTEGSDASGEEEPVKPTRRGDDPLELRACHNVPISLLPTIEIDGGSSYTPVELLAAEPEIVDGLVKTRKSEVDPELIPEGLRPGARLDVRWAMESDSKARTKAKDSEWYRRYGRNAGKGPENVIAPDEILATEHDRAAGFGSSNGRRRRIEPRDRERRGGRTRSRSPSDILGYGRRHRDGEGFEGIDIGAGDHERAPRGRHQDQELYSGRRGNRSQWDRNGGERDRGGGKKSQADLDRELDDFFSSR